MARQVRKKVGQKNGRQPRKKSRQVSNNKHVSGKQFSESLTRDFLNPTPGPEIFFGLVAPIGVDLDLLTEVLIELLEECDYHSEIVRLTKFLRSEFPLPETDHEQPLDERYEQLIKLGNHFRECSGRNDAMGLLATLGVRETRSCLSLKEPDRAVGNDELLSMRRQAYIIRQLKRPEEILTLRRVYGRKFVVISAISPKDDRLNVLSKAISRSHHNDQSPIAYRKNAQALISQDEREESVPHGQRVGDAFALSDVIIDARDKDAIRESLGRFIKAFFGDTFQTPTIDEYGAFLAYSQALRSADLSRQVGAVILGERGVVLSAGCNEVPRAGGGAYWHGDDDDTRDFRTGYDSSETAKREIIADILNRLKGSEWLSEDKSHLSVEDLLSNALNASDDAPLKGALVTNVLEYGRVVHAEMMAITEAARTGSSVKNATLYCTTFPCHNCARHIVASGISRVVYLEPYPKSLAQELYPDSIEINPPSSNHSKKVRFETLYGVAPERYIEVFRMRDSRKQTGGKVKRWKMKNAEPIMQQIIPAYLDIEVAVLADYYRLKPEWLRKWELPK